MLVCVNLPLLLCSTQFYYPDQFVRKKVAKLILKCKFHERKCPWTGFLTEWESHLETCKFGEKTCPDCKSTINNSKVSIGIPNMVFVSTRMWVSCMGGIGCPLQDSLPCHPNNRSVLSSTTMLLVLYQLHTNALSLHSGKSTNRPAQAR